MNNTIKKVCACCGEKGATHIKLEFYLCDKHSSYDFFQKELIERRTKKVV